MQLDSTKFIKLDLTISNKHEHSDIRLGRWYVAKIKSEYYLGKFVIKSYGLCFDGFGQFDAPGFNHSDWEEIWEVI